MSGAGPGNWSNIADPSALFMLRSDVRSYKKIRRLKHLGLAWASSRLHTLHVASRLYLSQTGYNLTENETILIMESNE